MNKSYREFRHKLFKHFEEVGGKSNPEEAKKKIHEKVFKQSDWDYLCDQFSSKEYLDMSERNKKNRAENDKPSLQGSKSIIALAYDKRDPVTEKLPGRISLYHDFSGKRKQWVNENAENAYVQLQSVPANGSEPKAKNEDDIVDKVLGKWSRYLKGWGQLSKKNTNESSQKASVPSSSTDVHETLHKQ
ncbi:hypothetical protein TIFTF001_016475 [Ficus carica]|uniref:Uncharacterized protein n=1 Tax=Ficus carica TaxID=3494 RepID=A0AA88A366_FICCA|nr:hypothetical protein TIFTF001_016475 [Ficus carica]